jgi:hypothetical protein
MESSPAKPSWFVRLFMVTARTLVLTFLFALLGMAVGLFFGIIITALRGHAMSEAYRVFAIPVAITSGAGALIWNVVQAFRRTRPGSAHQTSLKSRITEQGNDWIRGEIRQVLMTHWDPIGVKDEPAAQDEYDIYIGGLLDLLLKGASDRQISRYLSDIVEQRMELCPDRAAEQATIRELRKIFG